MVWSNGRLPEAYDFCLTPERKCLDTYVILVEAWPGEPHCDPKGSRLKGLIICLGKGLGLAGSKNYGQKAARVISCIQKGTCLGQATLFGKGRSHRTVGLKGVFETCRVSGRMACSDAY